MASPLPPSGSSTTVVAPPVPTVVVASEVSVAPVVDVERKRQAANLKKNTDPVLKNHAMTIDEMLAESREGLSGEVSNLVAETFSKIETKESAEALNKLKETAKSFAD